MIERYREREENMKFPLETGDPIGRDGRERERESSSCHSRSLSWFVKPCIPSSERDPHCYFSTPSPLPLPLHFISTPVKPPSLQALPDDLLLECLSRLPASSIPSLPLVSRRFNRLLNSL